VSSAAPLTPGTTASTGHSATRAPTGRPQYDEQRATFAHLSPSTFGFDPYDDDPYD